MLTRQNNYQRLLKQLHSIDPNLPNKIDRLSIPQEDAAKLLIELSQTNPALLSEEAIDLFDAQLRENGFSEVHKMTSLLVKLIAANLLKKENLDFIKQNIEEVCTINNLLDLLPIEQLTTERLQTCFNSIPIFADYRAHEALHQIPDSLKSVELFDYLVNLPPSTPSLEKKIISSIARTQVAHCTKQQKTIMMDNHRQKITNLLRLLSTEQPPATNHFFSNNNRCKRKPSNTHPPQIEPGSQKPKTENMSTEMQHISGNK